MPENETNILWLEYDGSRYASEASRAVDALMPEGTAPHAMALDAKGDLAVIMGGSAVAVLLLDKDDRVAGSEVHFAPFGVSLRRMKQALDRFRGRTVRYQAL